MHTNLEKPVTPTGSNVAGSATATASSENGYDGQTAAKAIDGVISGYPGDHTAEWATAGGGAGSWLQLTWPGPVQLNAVSLFDRPNEGDQATGATLTFSDGSTVSVPALDNAGAATTVTFPARSTTSLRITLTSVSSTTGNVGLSEVQAWGTGPVITPPPAPVKPTGSNVAGSATATASSENPNDGQTAAKAIDGVISGYPGDHTAEWATAGGGAGSWLQLTWPGPVQLNAVSLFDRPNEFDQATGATLTFSDGSTVSVPALNNAGAATTVTFPARSTASLRITLTSVSSTTGNVGLSEVQAWGTGPVITAPSPALAPVAPTSGSVAAPSTATTSTSTARRPRRPRPSRADCADDDHVDAAGNADARAHRSGRTCRYGPGNSQHRAGCLRCEPDRSGAADVLTDGCPGETFPGAPAWDGATVARR